MELFSTRGAQGERTAFLREIFRLFSEELKDVESYALLAIRAAAAFPAAARLFDELARVELSHHTHLGQLLLHYGFAPIARRTPQREKPPGNAFSSDMLSLLEQTFAARIAEERRGAEAYRRLTNVAKTQSQVRLFEQIATEEEGHAAALEGMLARIKHS